MAEERKSGAGNRTEQSPNKAKGAVYADTIRTETTLIAERCLQIGDFARKHLRGRWPFPTSISYILARTTGTLPEDLLQEAKLPTEWNEDTLVQEARAVATGLNYSAAVSGSKEESDRQKFIDKARDIIRRHKWGIEIRDVPAAVRATLDSIKDPRKKIEALRAVDASISEISGKASEEYMRKLSDKQIVEYKNLLKTAESLGLMREDIGPENVFTLEELETYVSDSVTSSPIEETRRRISLLERASRMSPEELRNLYNVPETAELGGTPYFETQEEQDAYLDELHKKWKEQQARPSRKEIDQLGGPSKGAKDQVTLPEGMPREPEFDRASSEIRNIVLDIADPDRRVELIENLRELENGTLPEDIDRLKLEILKSALFEHINRQGKLSGREAQETDLADLLEQGLGDGDVVAITNILETWQNDLSTGQLPEGSIAYVLNKVGQADFQVFNQLPKPVKLTILQTILRREDLLTKTGPQLNDLSPEERLEVIELANEYDRLNTQAEAAIESSPIDDENGEFLSLDNERRIAVLKVYSILISEIPDNKKSQAVEALKNISSGLNLNPEKAQTELLYLNQILKETGLDLDINQSDIGTLQQMFQDRDQEEGDADFISDSFASEYGIEGLSYEESRQILEREEFTKKISTYLAEGYKQDQQVSNRFISLAKVRGLFLDTKGQIDNNKIYELLETLGLDTISASERQDLVTGIGFADLSTDEVRNLLFAERFGLIQDTRESDHSYDTQEDLTERNKTAQEASEYFQLLKLRLEFENWLNIVQTEIGKKETTDPAIDAIRHLSKTELADYWVATKLIDYTKEDGRLERLQKYHNKEGHTKRVKEAEISFAIAQIKIAEGFLPILEEMGARLITDVATTPPGAEIPFESYFGKGLREYENTTFADLLLPLIGREDEATSSRRIRLGRINGGLKERIMLLQSVIDGEEGNLSFDADISLVLTETLQRAQKMVTTLKSERPLDILFENEGLASTRRTDLEGTLNRYVISMIVDAATTLNREPLPHGFDGVDPREQFAEFADRLTGRRFLIHSTFRARKALGTAATMKWPPDLKDKWVTNTELAQLVTPQNISGVSTFTLDSKYKFGASGRIATDLDISPGSSVQFIGELQTKLTGLRVRLESQNRLDPDRIDRAERRTLLEEIRVTEIELATARSASDLLRVTLSEDWREKKGIPQSPISNVMHLATFIKKRLPESLSIQRYLQDFRQYLEYTGLSHLLFTEVGDMNDWWKENPQAFDLRGLIFTRPQDDNNETSYSPYMRLSQNEYPQIYQKFTDEQIGRQIDRDTLFIRIEDIKDNPEIVSDLQEKDIIQIDPDTVYITRGNPQFDFFWEREGLGNRDSGYIILGRTEITGNPELMARLHKEGLLVINYAELGRLSSDPQLRQIYETRINTETQESALAVISDIVTIYQAKARDVWNAALPALGTFGKNKPWRLSGTEQTDGADKAAEGAFNFPHGEAVRQIFLGLQRFAIESNDPKSLKITRDRQAAYEYARGGTLDIGYNTKFFTNVRSRITSREAELVVMATKATNGSIPKTDIRHIFHPDYLKKGLASVLGFPEGKNLGMLKRFAVMTDCPLSPNQEGYAELIKLRRERVAREQMQVLLSIFSHSELLILFNYQPDKDEERNKIKEIMFLSELAEFAGYDILISPAPNNYTPLTINKRFMLVNSEANKVFVADPGLAQNLGVSEEIVTKIENGEYPDGIFVEISEKNLLVKSLIKNRVREPLSQERNDYLIKMMENEVGFWGDATAHGGFFATIQGVAIDGSGLLDPTKGSLYEAVARFNRTIRGMKIVKGLADEGPITFHRTLKVDPIAGAFYDTPMPFVGNLNREVIDETRGGPQVLATAFPNKLLSVYSGPPTTAAKAKAAACVLGLVKWTAQFVRSVTGIENPGSRGLLPSPSQMYEAIEDLPYDVNQSSEFTLFTPEGPIHLNVHLARIIEKLLFRGSPLDKMDSSSKTFKLFFWPQEHIFRPILSIFPVFRKLHENLTPIQEKVDRYKFLANLFGIDTEKKSAETIYEKGAGIIRKTPILNGISFMLGAIKPAFTEGGFAAFTITTTTAFTTGTAAYYVFGKSFVMAMAVGSAAVFFFSYLNSKRVDDRRGIKMNWLQNWAAKKFGIVPTRFNDDTGLTNPVAIEPIKNITKDIIDSPI